MSSLLACLFLLSLSFLHSNGSDINNIPSLKEPIAWSYLHSYLSEKMMNETMGETKKGKSRRGRRSQQRSSLNASELTIGMSRTSLTFLFELETDNNNMPIFEEHENSTRRQSSSNSPSPSSPLPSSLSSSQQASPSSSRFVYRIGPGAKAEVIGYELLDSLGMYVRVPRTRLVKFDEKLARRKVTSLVHVADGGDGGSSSHASFPPILNNRIGSIQQMIGTRMNDDLRHKMLDQFNACYASELPKKPCVLQSPLSTLLLEIQLAFYLSGNFDVNENNVVVSYDSVTTDVTSKINGTYDVLPRLFVLDFEHLLTPSRWLLDDLPFIAWGRYHPELGWGRGQFPRDNVRTLNITQWVERLEEKRGPVEETNRTVSFFIELSQFIESENKYLAFSAEKLKFLYDQREKAPLVYYVLWKAAVWIRWPLSLSLPRQREMLNMKPEHGLYRPFLLSPFIQTRHFQKANFPSTSTRITLYRMLFDANRQSSLFKRLRGISSSFTQDHFDGFLSRCHQLYLRTLSY